MEQREVLTVHAFFRPVMFQAVCWANLPVLGLALEVSSFPRASVRELVK